jgi:hypothetical protein
MRAYGSLSGNFEGALQEYEAGEDITKGDVLTIAEGVVAPAAAGEVILGTAVNGGKDGDKILVNIDPLQKVILPASDLTVAMEGEHMDLEGTTGAQTADGSTHAATTAQLTLIKFISATEGVFTFFERVI